ncbi:MAG: hypothetical protein GY721_03105, partial [Deltaproteobacteria bacterium]|nr:hypothetical protein [Deltaproteobacteria bacterium]
MVYEEVNGVFQDERDTPRSEVERVQKDTHDTLSLAKQIQTKHEIEVAKRDAEKIAEEIRQAEQHRVLELSNTVEERLVDRQNDLTAEYDRTMSELARLSREKGDAARVFILHRQALIDGNTVLGEKIRLQKSDLEREFNHSMTAVEMARHQLEMGDAVQAAAAEEAEKIAAEYTAAWADGRAEAITPGNGAPSKDTFSLVQTTRERQGGGITAGKHQKLELSGEKPPVLQGDAVERRKRERDLVQARRIEETAAATKRHLEDT